MMVNATFNNIYIVAVRFFGEGYPEKTTNRSQITDKRYHLMLYRVHIAMSGIRTRNVNGDMH